jgi:hypothetical protein
MRHYEVMLILDPSLEDKDAKAAVDRFLTTITSRGGTVGTGHPAPGRLTAPDTFCARRRHNRGRKTQP